MLFAIPLLLRDHQSSVTLVENNSVNRPKRLQRKLNKCMSPSNWIPRRKWLRTTLSLSFSHFNDLHASSTYISTVPNFCYIHFTFNPFYTKWTASWPGKLAPQSCSDFPGLFCLDDLIKKSRKHVNCNKRCVWPWSQLRNPKPVWEKKSSTKGWHQGLLFLFFVNFCVKKYFQKLEE